MKVTNIEIAPFHFTSLLQCSVEKKVNQHFHALISGYIAVEDADSIVWQCNEKTQVSVCIKDESGNKDYIFRGIIESLTIKSENGLKKLTVSALSYTSLLEKKEWIRTFQNENQTYRQVAEYISSQNSGSVFIYTKGSEKIGRMVVQYNETDWDFLKRMASNLNTVIVSDSRNNNICLSFGMPKKADAVKISPIMFRVVKNVDEYIHKQELRIPGMTEQDTNDYIVKSRDLLELCSPVSFMGLQLIVCGISTELEGSEMVHTYVLRTANGLQTIARKNSKIVGASITGEVLDVDHDLVKVRINSHSDRPDGVAKWFYYSTVYSSPDGAGWYCMPERGDTIRVYFPDDEENNAYVISAVHLGVVDDLRKNPDEKSIRTIYDKEVRLTPDEILITNHKGMSISLNDKEGINISSKKGISLSTSGSITLTSGSCITGEASQGVFLSQNGNSLSIYNGIRQYGLSISNR